MCSVISVFCFIIRFFILGLYFTFGTKGKLIISVGGIDIRDNYIDNLKELIEKYAHNKNRNTI